jgi:hypothetical protein
MTELRMVSIKEGVVSDEWCVVGSETMEKSPAPKGYSG